MSFSRSVSPGQLRKLLYCLRLGSGRYRSCDVAGISHRLFNQLMRESPEFVEDVQAAEAVKDERVEQALYTTATEDRSVRAIEFWLTNRQPDKWKKRADIKQEVTGNVNTTIDLKKLSLDELEQVENIMRKLDEE